MVEHFVKALNLLVLLEETRHKRDDTALEKGSAFELHHVVADLHMFKVADCRLANHLFEPGVIDQVLNVWALVEVLDEAMLHKVDSLRVELSERTVVRLLVQTAPVNFALR